MTKIIRQMMPLDIKLMFMQGLVSKNLKSDPSDYLYHFIPGVSKLIERYPSIVPTLQSINNLYPWGILTLTTIEILIVFPVDIYMNWDDKLHVIENIYVMLVYSILGAGFATSFFKKEEFNLVINKLETLSNPDNLDNDEQRKLLKSTQNVCFKITKYIHIYACAIFCIGIPLNFAVELWPKRKLLTRGWYPYDVTASPAYEITAFVFLIQQICSVCSACTLGLFGCSLYTYVRMHFKILRNKLQNIRDISIQRLKDRKVKESMQLRGNAFHTQTRVRHNAYETCHVHEGHVGFDVGPPGSTGRPLRIATRGGGVLQRYPRRVIRVRPARRHVMDEQNEQVGKELENEMNANLKECIKLHQILLRVAQDMGKIFNGFFFLLFLVNILVYSLSEALLATVSRLTVKEIVLTAATTNIIVIFLVYTYLANEITIQSVAVGDSAYASDWIQSSPQFKKSLLVIMCRANTPVLFKPTGVEPFSLGLFAKVSRKAYEMLTTINSIVLK